MRGWKVVFGAMSLVLSVGGAVQAAEEVKEAPVPGSTKANLEKAMRDEAFAYAEYSVFAAAAERSGHRDVAKLFRRTAHDELRDHFTRQARRIGFVGGDLANLKAAIDGESQDLLDYGRWAREAAADRCPAVAKALTEVRQDESEHLVHYAAAAKALVDPGSRTAIPAPSKVDPSPLRKGPARCGARTVRNLRAAMAGESFATAKYTLYADHARASGRTRLAALFKGAAEVELRDHFTAEAGFAGMIGGTAANLRAAIAAESGAIKVYGSYAKAAIREGDRSTAKMFRDFQRDEMRHRAAFRAALAKLRHGGGDV